MSVADRTPEIRLLDPNVQAYAFAFGYGVSLLDDLSRPSTKAVRAG